MQLRRALTSAAIAALCAGSMAHANTTVDGRETYTGAGHGSRLAAQDRIVLCPFGDPSNNGAESANAEGTTWPNCRSVSNVSTANDYFVPWNTGREWAAFVAAQSNAMVLYRAGRGTMPDMQLGTVCPRQGTFTICEGTPHEQTLDASTFNQRQVGVIQGYSPTPLGRYAAEGDIFTLQIAPGEMLTLACMPQGTGQPGHWVVTTAPESCKPSPAECASTRAVRGDKPYVNSDPQPRENLELCAPGNKTSPADFAYTSPGSWQWTCHGNDGSSKLCQGSYHPRKLPGRCGWFNGKESAVDLEQSYYSPGGSYDKFRAMCDAGMVINFAVVTPGLWQWTCQGINGGADSAVCSSRLKTEDGICGLAHGTKVPTAPNVQSGNMCASGFAWPTTAQFNPAPQNNYTWRCLGNNESAQTSDCAAGKCGACVGNLAGTMRFNASGTIPVTTPGGSVCQAQVVAEWQTDGGARTSVLSDRFIYSGAYLFSLPYSRPTDEMLCQPCYVAGSGQQHSARITIRADVGTCPGDPQLNSGQPVTLN